MHRLLPILILALVLTACGSPPAGESPRLLSVSGSGEVTAVPDRATLRLGVEARSKELATAQAQADRVVAAVLEVTDRQGIPRERVQTTALSIDPEFDWRPEGRRMLGYLVRREVSVELQDLARLGPLMEEALATGVNDVSPPALSSSRAAELRRAALEAAAEDAVANAAALAEGLGARVGKVWGASGSSDPHMQPGPRPMVMAAMAEGRAKGEVAETYSQGQIRYTASVQAQFEVR